jgi:hypothetical protein
LESAISHLVAVGVSAARMSVAFCYTLHVYFMFHVLSPEVICTMIKAHAN